MLLDNEDKISVSVPGFSQLFIKTSDLLPADAVSHLCARRQTGWWKN